MEKPLALSSGQDTVIGTPSGQLAGSQKQPHTSILGELCLTKNTYSI